MRSRSVVNWSSMPLITHNGALLKYAQTEQTVHCSLLTTEASLEIVRVGKDYGGDALVSTDPNGRGTLLFDRVSEDNLPLKSIYAGPRLCTAANRPVRASRTCRGSRTYFTSMRSSIFRSQARATR